MRLEDLADRPFRSASLVVLGRIDVIDPGVEGRPEHVVVAQGTGAKADVGDIEARPPEPPVGLDLELRREIFDDFIAAAEYLIKEKYTSTPRLAIEGGSNGGLLVGAVMAQRPELFGVALPAVGVMDMLRFHKFTVGWGWAVEYGSSDKEDQFAYLYKYSPLHNLKPGVCYPATMITTADHDDRVVPAHSFKFAATLQAAHACAKPVVIRIETRSGHGSSNLSKAIEELSDQWSFMFYNMNITPIYK